MGLVDVFSSEDRANLKVNELLNYFKEVGRVNAENKVMVNGLRAGLPAEHILIMAGYLGTDYTETCEVKP